MGNCHKCKKSNIKNCGCGTDSKKYPVVARCSVEEECEGEGCLELYKASCIVWDLEAPLKCNGSIVANKGDRLPVILERILATACEGNCN